MTGRRFGRRWLAVGAVVLLAAGATVGSAADDDVPYVQNIYLTTGRPQVAVRGRWVFDISTPERMDDMLAELAAMGVSAVTYHSAYRQDGADYTPKDPALKRAPRWGADDAPVDWFLQSCARHGMAGYLAVFLSPTIDPDLAKAATRDMLDTFGGRRGLAGYVPPIEASPMRQMPNDRFLDLCRLVKSRWPSLKIMDYPNGPYSPAIVRLIAQRGGSGLVDIENVQFHAADPRLGSFVVSRGMTHLVMGLCPRARAIVHTHYKYGGNSAWLKPSDAYLVRQGAVITATPHGTSIFSFPHGFWGEETGPGGGDALWRRLAWYEAMLAVQRIVPVYLDAQNAARVAVLIPANTRLGGQEIVQRYWQPLSVDPLCGAARMFSRAEQLDPATRVVVCPSLEDCDRQQRRMIEPLAAAGRTVVVAGGAGPQTPGKISPRAQRILGYAPLMPLDTDELSPRLVEALGGLSGEGSLAQVSQASSTPLGKGRIVRIPGDDAWLADSLGGLVAELVPAAPPFENLPEGYLAESWRTRASAGGVPFVLLLATRRGLETHDVVLSVPGDRPPKRAWLLDRDSAEPLVPERSGDAVRVRVPRVGDEYAAVVLGSTPAVTLRPHPLLARAGAGRPVRLTCRVVNTTDQPAEGTVTVSLPQGWKAGPWAGEYRLESGQSADLELTVEVRGDAQRRPHFVAFRTGGAVQRTMVFVEDGRPQVISSQPVPKTAARPKTPRSTPLLDERWREVVAGEPGDDAVTGHMPGVCFFPRSPEWDAPITLDGKPCRYAELLPRLGGANFLVNGADPSADLEVRLTYRAKAAGQLVVYDGHKYHAVGPLSAAAEEGWRTDEFRVPRELFSGADADRRTEPGLNVLFEVHANGVWVHAIAARRAPGD